MSSAEWIAIITATAAAIVTVINAWVAGSRYHTSAAVQKEIKADVNSNMSRALAKIEALYSEISTLKETLRVVAGPPPTDAKEGSGSQS